MISDRNMLDSFATRFCSIVERFTDYIIVSGFVVISSGRARSTEDIDMILKVMEKSEFKKLHEALRQGGFECLQGDESDVLFDDYLIQHLAIRYIEKGTYLPNMEVKFAKDLLDDYQLKNRVKLELTGLDLWFSDININIAFKEHLLKSKKDLEDARHLRITYRELVDEEKIKKIRDLIDRYRLQ